MNPRIQKNYHHFKGVNNMGLDNYPDGYNAGDYEEYIAQDSQDDRDDYYDK